MIMPRSAVDMPSGMVLGLACVLVTAGCQEPPRRELAPPKVVVTQPLVQTVRDFADFTGNLEAAQSAELRARITGTLTEADFEEGRMVEAGDLLFLIDPQPFEAQLAASQGRLSQAEANYQLAEANRRRAATLLPRGSITQQEYDTRAAEVAVAQADVEVQQAAVRNSQIDLSYTRIEAPFKGRVGRRMVDVGNLVTGTPTTLLTTIEQVDPINAYFPISENVILPFLRERASGRRPGEHPVYIALGDEEKFTHVGVIDFLDNTVDPATGTVMARGRFDNTTGVLFPGLFVRVRIPLEPLENAVLVEQAAVGTDLGGRFVLVVDDENIVHQRYVELGPLFGVYQVVTKGLEAGENYIVEGVQFARPGLAADPEVATNRPRLVLNQTEDLGDLPTDPMSSAPPQAPEGPDQGPAGNPPPETNPAGADAGAAGTTSLNQPAEPLGPALPPAVAPANGPASETTPEPAATP